VSRAFGEFSRNGRADHAQVYGHWNDILAEDQEKRVCPLTRILGKNACDIVMVIEAMDVLHYNQAIDTFALVSSDSDFAPLACRLREAGKIVFGFGCLMTSPSFRQSVDVWTTIENLKPLEMPVVRCEGVLDRIVKDEHAASTYTFVRDAAGKHFFLQEEFFPSGDGFHEGSRITFTAYVRGEKAAARDAFCNQVLLESPCQIVTMAM
jgi:hypothetical protein